MTSGVDPEVLPTLISFKERIIFIFIHANVLPTECLCTIHMPSTNKLLKGMLDLLELFVNYHVGPESASFARAVSAFKHGAIPPGLDFSFI